MAGKGMNDPHPCLEIVIHIQPGTGDLNLIESLSTGGERRVSSSVASVRDSVFFTVLQ